MKKCANCGSTKNLSKHHVYPKDNMLATPKQHYSSPKITLCRDCHDKVHADKSNKMLKEIIKKIVEAKKT